MASTMADDFEEEFEVDKSDPEFIFKQLSLDVRGNNYV